MPRRKNTTFKKIYLYDKISTVMKMIAILKIDSADVINRMDSEKFQLRMIPSTKIKLDSEEMKFYEPIFFDDVDIVEVPDPSEYISRNQIPEYYWDYIQNCIENNSFPTEEQLNTDNYLYKYDMPTFYWNFSKYVLTNPLNITPSNYSNLCTILQAIPRLHTNAQIYNFTNATPNIFIRPANPSITSSTFETTTAINMYGAVTPINILKLNDGDCAQSNIYLSLKDIHKLEIEAVIKPISSGGCVITSFSPITNMTNIATYILFRVLNNNNDITAVFGIKKDTTSGGQNAVTTTIQKSALQSYYKVYGRYYYDNTNATIETQVDDVFIIDTNTYTTQKIANDTVTLASSKIPTTRYTDRLGMLVVRYSGATVNTSMSGEKNLLHYSLSIDDKPVTIIEPNNSKILSENLMTIV